MGESRTQCSVSVDPQEMDTEDQLLEVGRKETNVGSRNGKETEILKAEKSNSATQVHLILSSRQPMLFGLRYIAINYTFCPRQYYTANRPTI